MSETEGQQVTTQETGRCEKAAHEVAHSSWNQRFNESLLQMATAATIDRLAADVEAVRGEVQRILPCLMTPAALELACDRHAVLCERDAAIRERDQWREEARLAVINRDEARAEVERLKAELAARQADGNRQATLDSSPAVTEPAQDASEEIAELKFWVEKYRVKAEAYGGMVRGCSPALERAGHPVNGRGPDGAVGGIARAVEALICERDEARAKVERLNAELAADVAAIKEAVCDGSVAEERDRFLAGMGSAIKERDAAIRERDEWKEEARLAVVNRDAAICERDAANQRRADTVRRLVQAQAEVAQLRDSRDVANRLYGAAQAEVERLRAELAARPAANSPGISDSSPAAPQPTAPAAGWKPDYYIVTNEHDMPIHVSRTDPSLGWAGWTITALYAHPHPAAPPPWWLTEEERVAVEAARNSLRQGHTRPAPSVAGVLDRLLARAVSPPVVVVPDLPSNFYARSEAERYRVAIDKAGVQWKEVGRE